MTFVLYVDGSAVSLLDYMSAAAAQRDSDKILRCLRDLSRQLPGEWCEQLLDVRYKMTVEDDALFIVSHVWVVRRVDGTATAYFDYPPNHSLN